jgi:hypothetical protein
MMRAENPETVRGQKIIRAEVRRRELARWRWPISGRL